MVFSGVNARRGALMLSMDELADAAGVSVTTVRKMERGESVRASSLRAVLSALEVLEAEKRGETLASNVEETRAARADANRVVVTLPGVTVEVSTKDGADLANRLAEVLATLSASDVAQAAAEQALADHLRAIR